MDCVSRQRVPEPPDGSSGSTFISALTNFFTNIKTAQLWDSVLGISSIVLLVILNYLPIPSPSPTASAHARRLAHVWTYLIRARNAIVVFIGALIAYALHLHGIVPFALTGKIEGGLPHFSPPPFSTLVHNSTVDFEGMLSVFGVEGFVMPLVAILESIAIAKAFAGTASVDATQEMLAIGACNLVSSFCQCMPTTGSFTRTALNHASGVLTPAGAFFKATLVLLAVTLLAPAFYFIPRATLAAVILVAMASLVDLHVAVQLWRNSKLELVVYTVCVVCGACAALEWGIAAGAACDLLRAAAATARPKLPYAYIKVGNQDCLLLTLIGPLLYSSAEHIPREVKKRVLARTDVIILDASKISSMDVGVAENLVAAILDLESSGHKTLMWNFSDQHQKLLEDLHEGFRERFVTGSSIDQHILAGTASVDATQEMLAIGARNLVSSFCQCMPTTGSFTRTALNHASGVLTPAGAFFKATLVLLAVTLLAPAFYFIPRATLAAVILVAMASLVDLHVAVQLWRNSKLELVVYTVCVVCGACAALEWGIAAGAACDLLRAAAATARPKLPYAYIKVGNQDCLLLTLIGPLLYSSAEHIPREVKKRVLARTDVIILDASKISSMDVGVAENLVAAILDLESSGHKTLMWNFSDQHQKLLEDLHEGFRGRFVTGPSIDQHILGLSEDIVRRTN